MPNNGLIYILSHSSGNSVKVGETKRSAEERLNSYSREYQLRGFSFHSQYEVPLNARREVEKLAHRKLAEYQLAGLEGAREIFACSVETAVQAVEEAIQQSSAVRREQAHELREQRRKTREEKERKKKREAKAKFYFERGNDWAESERGQQLQNELDEFLQNNVLEKSKGRWFVWLLSGYLGFAGTSYVLGSVLTFFEGNFTADTLWLVFGGAFFCFAARWVWMNVPRKLVPIKHAVEKKKRIEFLMEEEKIAYITSHDEEFETRYANGEFIPRN